MILRVRKRTRTLAGAVPEDPVEKRMWLIWVPLIIAWMVLPYQAGDGSHWLLALPAGAREQPWLGVRTVAALGGVACLLLTATVWRRMGKDWRMAVSVHRQSELITDGLFRYVRHPIYALSVLLMLCSVIVAPTVPMLAIAVTHIALMVMKAKNEERYLLDAYGERYARYLARTGGFFPHFSGRP
jgi:protein-S-isoprenylcysteine O-methyltransferase Ste14